MHSEGGVLLIRISKDLSISVMNMGNTDVARHLDIVKHLKVGIMKDLHKNGLITQRQMEQAIFRINSEKSGKVKAQTP